MLTCLLTVCATTPAEFVSAARASVQAAAGQAGFPVEVIEVPGVPGNIGQAMANGLAKATQPWVCWVDDDDMVMPAAFSVLLPHLADQVPAIFARERRLLANGKLISNPNRHHLSVYRREAAQAVPLAAIKSIPNEVLARSVKGAIDLPDEVYIYRVRLSPGLALRGQLSKQEYALWGQ